MLLVYAAFVGLTAAGFTASLWGALTGAPPSAALLHTRDWLMPLRVLVLVFSAPLLLLRGGAREMEVSPPMGVAVIAAGGTWSFFEGVFILTMVFALP
jgi:hypothetical protein